MWIIGFILGTILGSFVKALSDRSLNLKSFRGRSYCPKCQHQLAWYDLLPVFSYILLNGKCRYCHKKIGSEYLVVEVVMGVLVGFLFWQTTLSLRLLCHPELVSGSNEILKQVQNDISCINSINWFQLFSFVLDLLFKTFFIVVLAILFLTDLKKMFIPDRIVVPAIWISITFILVITIIKITYLYYSLTQTFLGQKLLETGDYFQRHALSAAQPLIGGILMGLLIAGFFLGLIFITKGKGMGGGDVKLGAFIGVMLGFPGALVALVLSFLTGAIFSIALIAVGKKHFGQTIPFGPFLVLGSLIVLFWGNQIVEWYLRLGS